MNGTTPPVRILRPRESCQKLGLGKTLLYELIAKGELKPIRLSARAVGFYEHELDAWLVSRVNNS